MKIQILNYDKQENNGTIVYTKLSSPRSLDEFDINIIRINENSSTKNILFEVTDKTLLDKYVNMGVDYITSDFISPKTKE